MQDAATVPTGVTLLHTVRRGLSAEAVILILCFTVVSIPQFFKKIKRFFRKLQISFFCAKALPVFLDNFGKIRLKSLDKRTVWEYHYYAFVFSNLSLIL